MNRRAQAYLGMAVSAAALVAVFWNVEWHEVGEHFREVDWKWFPVCAALFAFQYWLRALRWRHLIRGGAKVSLARAIDAVMLGNFASFVLPLRAGEFVRPFALSQWTGLSFPACFVSVVIERFFDLSCVLLSFAILVAEVPGVPALAYHGALSLGVLAVAILLFIVVGTVVPDRLLGIMDVFLRVLPDKFRVAMRKFFSDFLHGCDVLRKPSTLAAVSLYTALVWLSTFLLFGVFLLFCNLPMNTWLSVALGVLIALAVAAPSAPGFLGVYEGGVTAAFLLFGLSQSSAVAYGLITHGINYVIFCACGMAILVRSNMRWSDMTARPGSSKSLEV
jgi:uncharacterized protein (TIRG00374 family)